MNPWLAYLLGAITGILIWDTGAWLLRNSGFERDRK